VRRPAPAGQSRYVIPYTNGRAINWGEEVRTFVDEWSTVDVADPRWPGEERFVRNPAGGFTLAAYGRTVAPTDVCGIAYAVDPRPELAGHGPPLPRAMLETFADGIYYDNYFLVANYNPLEPGYVDDDGIPAGGVHLRLPRSHEASSPSCSTGWGGDP